MNSAYKHLDAKLKLAELTLGQWCGVTIGVGVAIIWGFYLSPFGMYLTAGSAVYLGAIPAGFALMSTFYEIDLWVVIRSAVGWARLDGVFAPGAGQPTPGYLVRDVPADADRLDGRGPALDLAALWES
jgi:hypothetical protein